MEKKALEFRPLPPETEDETGYLCGPCMALKMETRADYILQPSDPLVDTPFWFDYYCKRHTKNFPSDEIIHLEVERQRSLYAYGDQGIIEEYGLLNESPQEAFSRLRNEYSKYIIKHAKDAGGEKHFSPK